MMVPCTLYFLWALEAVFFLYFAFCLFVFYECYLRRKYGRNSNRN